MQPNAGSWFRNTVLYQIYPRSFYDSDGDGVGDIRGIIQKLPYLRGEEKSLGIDALWLSPMYPSPMADFGYDVMDYTDIDPLFGTLDDFKELVEKAHLRGIKVLTDFIPNHTSHEHPWFTESKSSRDNPRRDWYVWRDPSPDGGPPNNWLSVFGGSAWEYDEATRQYYLHSFLKEQPDVNWDNAGLREAMRQALKFWLDLGVDGFRLDAVYWMSKDPTFRNDPVNPHYEEGKDDPYNALLHRHSRESKRLYAHLNEIARTLKGYPEKFMIVEASPELFDMDESYLRLYRHIDPSVCAPFNFEGLHLPWKADVFRDFIDDFQARMHPDYVPVYCMGNHDVTRLSRRIGREQARMAIMMQLTLPGLPVIYYGDELGMGGVDVPPELSQDPFGKRVPGKTRDPERTPFQWDVSEHAGFSSATPWLPLGSDHTEHNLEREATHPTSMFNLYRALISLRQKTSALKHGSYRSINTPQGVYGYIRRYAEESMLVLLNFSDESKDIQKEELSGNVLLSTYMDIPVSSPQTIHLRSHEGIIMRLDH